MVAEILKGRGLRGWLRLARVARVLGLFTLYLFLDTYDIRADFNRRMVERLRDETKANNLSARLKARYHEFLQFCRRQGHPDRALHRFSRPRRVEQKRSTSRQTVHLVE